MTTFRFDLDQTAAVSGFGMVTLAVTDDRADETRAALATLGFTGVQETNE